MQPQKKRQAAQSVVCGHAIRTLTSQQPEPVNAQPDKREQESKQDQFVARGRDGGENGLHPAERGGDDAADRGKQS